MISLDIQDCSCDKRWNLKKKKKEKINPRHLTCVEASLDSVISSLFKSWSLGMGPQWWVKFLHGICNREKS